MAARLRTPALGLAGLSMCLSLAVIGTAGRSLNVYFSQRTQDPWLLPLWPSHFDSQELQLLVGASGAIFILNAALAVALLMPALPANAIVLVSACLSTIVASLTVAFSTAINNHAPNRDTLQTWTCRWAALDDQSAPSQFHGLCAKTRFAYYSTIPLLVIQILLFGVGLYVIFARPSHHRGGHQEIEKQQGLQLQNVRQGNDSGANLVPSHTGSDGRRIYQDSNGYYGVAK